jgi:hypothetical protein
MTCARASPAFFFLDQLRSTECLPPGAARKYGSTRSSGPAANRCSIFTASESHHNQIIFPVYLLSMRAQVWQSQSWQHKVVWLFRTLARSLESATKIDQDSK